MLPCLDAGCRARQLRSQVLQRFRATTVFAAQISSASPIVARRDKRVRNERQSFGDATHRLRPGEAGPRIGGDGLNQTSKIRLENHLPVLGII
ncbi:hypothetical protein SAMN02799625_06016 [Methylobacterium sp. UNC300MFChir4.1]|nr:hypothetical protein SAMN02799625_06016 [Methylobacterium sp. UNC300MFChir4.1]SFT30629.1 hypothetical protein SAMN04487845_1836 [Methylobacterium sp. yr668]